MRFAFCGKGGSGKSTLASLAIRGSHGRDRRVLAIDADINMHLAQALALTAEERSRVVSFDAIKKDLVHHLVGRSVRLPAGVTPPRTLPPTLDSGFVHADHTRGFLSKFPQARPGLMVLVSGTYQEDDVGWSCHHARLGDLQVLLNHLLDGSGDLVVADMTAGTDAFGVGLFSLFDRVYWVVEPTQKSVELFQLFQPLAESEGLDYRVVLNKVESPEDRDFLLSRIPPERVVAAFTHSRFVRAHERNQVKDLSELEPENQEALKALLADFANVQRNWGALYGHILRNHLRAAEKWPKGKFDYDLRQLVDPAFSFSAVDPEVATANPR
jgi:CO dehydrogenase maturation factor